VQDKGRSAMSDLPFLLLFGAYEDNGG